MLSLRAWQTKHLITPVQCYLSQVSIFRVINRAAKGHNECIAAAFAASTKRPAQLQYPGCSTTAQRLGLSCMQCLTLRLSDARKGGSDGTYGPNWRKMWDPTKPTDTNPLGIYHSTRLEGRAEQVSSSCRLWLCSISISKHFGWYIDAGLPGFIIRILPSGCILDHCSPSSLAL